MALREVAKKRSMSVTSKPGTTSTSKSTQRGNPRAKKAGPSMQLPTRPVSTGGGD